MTRPTPALDNPLFRTRTAVIRPTGEYGDDGIWKETIATEEMTYAVAQPFREGEDVQAGGVRRTGMMAFYLKPGAPIRPGRDRVRYNSDIYLVDEVIDWGSYREVRGVREESS